MKGIGPAGGSIVRSGARLLGGSDTVRYNLTKGLRLCTVDVLKDITDCPAFADPSIKIGKRPFVATSWPLTSQPKPVEVMGRKVARIIVTLKAVPDDVHAMLIRRGAVITFDEGQGASHMLKSRWSTVANAIGLV